MAMEGTADCGAMSEALVFLEHFRDLPDPRQRGKVIYPLNEVLLLCPMAVLAGAENHRRCSALWREEDFASAALPAVLRAGDPKPLADRECAAVAHKKEVQHELA
jgi:hypothetical protein